MPLQESRPPRHRQLPTQPVQALVQMRRQGWLDALPGEDGRTVLLRITPAGRRLVEEAIPAWQQAQEQATALLGERQVRTFGRAATTLRKKSTTTRA